MKKRTIIIISLIVVILLGLGFWYRASFVLPKKAIAEKCEGYQPNWSDFVDCYGAISVNDGWDMDYLSIKDHVRHYEIARVDNQKQYICAGQKLFVINLHPIENSSSNGVKTTYYQKLFQNGQLTDNTYDSISEIPKYFVIDTTSGEVKVYKNLTDIPLDQQSYFGEISKIN